jgi:hypothetical protein
MQVGDLVKHIVWDYIGIVIDKDECLYYIQVITDDGGCEWYGENVLEVVCK